MITVEVSSNTADKPDDNFIENTVRHVRKHEGTPLFLIVNVDRPAYLVIEVEGEEYQKLPLVPQPQAFKLAELLRKPERPSRFGNLIKPLVGRLATPQAQPSEFTARIHEDNPDGPRIGTYDFKLLGDAEYDAAYEQYVGVKPQVCVFTNDARSIDTAHDCWNCKKPLAPGVCCAECGCEQFDESGQ